jgi:hypothetical protein
MPLYRIKPGRSVNQTGRIYTDKDDPIEVPVHVAYELRASLEPVDKEGELPPGPETTVRQGPAMQEELRDHERLTVLELQRAQVEKQLTYIDGQLEDVRTKIETRTAKKGSKAESKSDTTKAGDKKEAAEKPRTEK